MAMESAEIDDFLRYQIVKVLSEEGAAEDVELEVNNDTQKGEHFLSITASIKGKGKKANGEVIIVPFFVKCSIKNVIWREGFNADALFQREVDFFNVIRPAFQKFQQRHSKSEENGLRMIPKCFSALTESARGVIILEDLMDDGYIMMDREKGLDLEKSLLVMRSLGILHSFSFAMRLKEGDNFRYLCDHTDEIFLGEANEKTLANSFQMNAMAVMEATKAYHPEAAEKLLLWIKDSSFKRISMLANERDEFSVINHGDTWINNLLFRKSSEKGWEVKFVDYQTIRHSSPVIDISYFLMTSVEPGVREEYLGQLLKEYHTTLVEWLEKFGCNDPGNVFPFHELETHMKKYSFFGLGMAMMFVPLYYTAPDESPDLEDCEDSSLGHLTRLHKVGMAKEIARKRMVSLVKHCYELGYI